MQLLKFPRMVKYLKCLFILLVSGGGIRAQNVNAVNFTAIPHKMFWENTPKSFSVTKDQIVIEAGKETDMFRDPNVSYNTDNAPKLLFEADDNFVLTASVEQAFANKWDGGAIVIKQDSLNWIKFCFEKDYTGAKRVVSVVTKGISDDCNSVEMTSSKVYYKVAKADNVITLYCSPDGIRWLLIRHLQFNTVTGFKVGFLAQSPTGDRCEVTFSNIVYTVKKIKDPYLGE
jgi:uncharacterized protein